MFFVHKPIRRMNKQKEAKKKRYRENLI